MQKCLIIEGSQVIRRVARIILQDIGFDVAEAATGREGLVQFHWQIPRLAIVDASLTDMSALDVLRKIRDTAAGRLQVLYCTTEFDLLEAQRANAAGATDILVKPFDRAALLAKLSAWPPSERAQMSGPGRLARTELVRAG